MRAVQLLGKLMNFDKNMSPNRTRRAARVTCRTPGSGGPIPSVNLTMVAFPGTAQLPAGKRTAPRYTYSPFFPVLHINDAQQLFFGGNFWDSRATGYILQQADAEQAQHPPVDTQEMGNRTRLASRSSSSRRVPTAVRPGVGCGLAGHQVPARYRGDLRDPWRRGRLRERHDPPFV
jgi:cytochrome c peroxidase